MNGNGDKMRVIREAIIKLAPDSKYEKVVYTQIKKYLKVPVVESTFYNTRRFLIEERDKTKAPKIVPPAPQEDGLVTLLKQLKAIKAKLGAQSTKQLLDIL